MGKLENGGSVRLSDEVVVWWKAHKVADAIRLNRELDELKGKLRSAQKMFEQLKAGVEEKQKELERFKE